MAAIKCRRCENVFDGNWVIMAFCERCLDSWCPDCWEQEQFAAMESETLADEERNLCAACWQAEQPHRTEAQR